MKYFAMFFVLMFAACSLVLGAEDLGELAKKEKQRREALAKQGKKGKRFTNADIKDLKSSLAIEVKQDPSAVTETGSPAASTQTATTSSTTPSQASTSNTAASQDQVPAQVQELQQQKAELESKVKDARERLGKSGLLHSRGAGNVYKEISDAEAQMKEIDKKIQELEQKPPAQNQPQ